MEENSNEETINGKSENEGEDSELRAKTTEDELPGASEADKGVLSGNSVVKTILNLSQTVKPFIPETGESGAGEANVDTADAVITATAEPLSTANVVNDIPPQSFETRNNFIRKPWNDTQFYSPNTILLWN